MAAPRSSTLTRDTLDKETMLPIHGQVRLSDRELKVISHPSFQRLFGIYQLGQTHLVYRGATHTRGEHSVGAVEAAMAMVAALDRSNRVADPISQHWRLDEALAPCEVALVRLGALLHDIGHLPAGHTLEDELGLLEHHDGDTRINLILDRSRWHNRDYRTLRSLIDELYLSEATAARQVDGTGRGLSASELLILLVSSDHKDASASPGTAFRVGVCRDLIGNTICADLIDYLHRDWLHLGKPKHFDPRLLEYLEIRRRRAPSGETQSKLVINLRGGSRPRPDAVTAILDLLESRYQLAEIALFHRVKLAAAGMLERVFSEYKDSFDTSVDRESAITALVDDLLECTDQEMLKLLERNLVSRRQSREARIDGAVDLVRRLLVRDLHRDLRTFYEDDVGSPQKAEVIANSFAGESADTPAAKRAAKDAAANNRLVALRTLEEDFGLTPGTIAMYCPSPTMNTKIAEVGIFVNELVGPLADLDIKDPRITGGHLDAQQTRFRRLWRVSFSISREAYAKLESAKLLEHLLDVVKYGVLRIPPELGTIEDQIEQVAREMTRINGSPWQGRQLVTAGAPRDEASLVYPGGAPSIRAFISG